MLRLLLDSPVLYWAITQPDRLIDAEREVLADPVNEVYVSPASLWELQLKVENGKLRLPNKFASAVKKTGFMALNVTMDHVNWLADLPNIHADPFDRILIAQAIHEKLTIVSRDKVMKFYPVSVFAE